MKLVLLGLCYLASLLAVPAEEFESGEALVIPPGYVTMPLVGGNSQFGLVGRILVGSNAQSLNFTFNTRSAALLYGGPGYTVSPSYVDEGVTAPVVLPNFAFQLHTYTANISREWFNLGGGAQIRGQLAGYVANDPSNTFAPNIGIRLESTLPSNDTFLDTAFRQAFITNKVVSFAVNYSNGDAVGQAYLGTLHAANFSSYPTNYSVDVDTGDWSMYLANVGTVSQDWGYNGYLTWDTNSPFSVVPQAVQSLMLDTLQLRPNATMIQVGNLTVPLIPCPTNRTYATFFYELAQAKILSFTPDQYLMPFNVSAETCLFAFAYSNTGAPYNAAPYTIGTYAFQNAYTSFDFENRWVGRTELVSS